jgi:hypothetical protein
MGSALACKFLRAGSSVVSPGARRIFTERLLGVAALCARRTVRLEEWLPALGCTLGGEASVRLVDLERRRVVDFLPDRAAGTLATWLQTQPYVMMVSCDRLLQLLRQSRYRVRTASHHETIICS